MTIQELGYIDKLDDYRATNGLDSFSVGRVISEHKERYNVFDGENRFDSELIGNLRYSAEDRADFPVVGDWVAISEYDDGKALIHAVYPRNNSIERQSVGRQGEVQLIASNIDYAFLVQAVDRDFNINRLERYLTICYSSKVEPVIVLTKTDLIDDDTVKEIESKVKNRIDNVELHFVSNLTSNGLAELKNSIKKAKTYCMLGSSGVGKSTLLNNLAGAELMETSHISESTNKGRHTTSHREMYILDNGGIIIDNPGMREVGMTNEASGLEVTFDTIAELSEECKFHDCTHTKEKGCAVLEALESGELDYDSYENYMKLEREKEHFESTVAERRQKEKAFGKVVKHFKNLKKQSRI